jgi:peptidoglycan hydrolase-like protein with peptidoglycan-binding domain
MNGYTVYPIIINSSSLISDTFNNKYVYTFPSGSVKFQKSKVALGNISIYYSWFNISVANQNNTYSFNFPFLAGNTLYTVVMPDGFYTISQINDFLQQFCITNNLYLVDSNGDYVYFLTFRENSTYYAVEVDTFAVPTAAQLAGLGYTNPNAIPLPAAATTTQLIVPSTLFRNLIGYTAGSYPAVQAATTQSFLSSFTPQVSPVQSLTLACSLLNNKYANPRTILFSFSPQVGFGSVIDVRPNEYFWVDIQDGNYASFQIEFLDQSFNPVKLNDTNLIVQLLIKASE